MPFAMKTRAGSSHSHTRFSRRDAMSWSFWTKFFFQLPLTEPASSWHHLSIWPSPISR